MCNGYIYINKTKSLDPHTRGISGRDATMQMMKIKKMRMKMKTIKTVSQSNFW